MSKKFTRVSENMKSKNMKKIIFFYLLAFFFIIAPVLAQANESDKLAKLAQSCESSQHYQDCVRSKFFNNLK